MDKRLYTYYVYNRLKKFCPNWPLSQGLTKILIEDISSNYRILERNLEQIHCNILYNNILIKRKVFIDGLVILKAELKRNKETCN